MTDKKTNSSELKRLKLLSKMTEAESVLSKIIYKGNTVDWWAKNTIFNEKVIFGVWDILEKYGIHQSGNLSTVEAVKQLAYYCRGEIPKTKPMPLFKRIYCYIFRFFGKTESLEEEIARFIDKRYNRQNGSKDGQSKRQTD